MKFRLAIASFVIAGAAFAIPASAAYADVIPGASSAPPSPQVVGIGGSTAPAVQAVTTAAPSGASLPLTGGDVAGMSLIGLALLGGGVVLVRRTRTKSADVPD